MSAEAIPLQRSRSIHRSGVGILTAALALVCVLAASIGAVETGLGDVIQVLLVKLGLVEPVSDPRLTLVIWELRLPRVILGVAVGAGLAVAGAGLQGLFRNPLADPGLIGVSAGAAVGAASIIYLEQWLPMSPTLLLPLAAFAGGMGATFVVYRLSHSDGQVSVTSMLLAGIAINAFAGALLGLISYLSDDAQLRSLVLWTLGSLASASWTTSLVAVACVSLGTVLIWRWHEALDALALGEREAAYLGVPLKALKRWMLVVGAAVVGVGIAFSGLIGFIGLVAPHIVRLLFGPSHRTLIVASALLGALLLVGSDVTARTVAAPAELPIGVVTALIGGPFFLVILLRQRHQFWSNG